MEEFRIVGINDSDYELADADGKLYKIRIEFYELGRKPEIGSSIRMSSKLLDKKYFEYSSMYYFGGVGSVYGRSPDAESYVTDIIEIEIDGNRIRQQRHYG